MGWCLLFWGQWLFWNLSNDSGLGMGGEMAARLVCAMIFSAVSFIIIYVIDAIADRLEERFRHSASVMGFEKGLRGVLRVFGFLMGLSWEACFQRGMTVLAMDFPTTNPLFI